MGKGLKVREVGKPILEKQWILIKSITRFAKNIIDTIKDINK